MAAARSKTLTEGNPLSRSATFSCFALAAFIFLVGAPFCVSATQYHKQITGSRTNYPGIEAPDGEISYIFQEDDSVRVQNQGWCRTKSRKF